MEILHNHKIHIPLFSLLFFLFHFSSLHFLSLAYEQPDDKYFVNCGSKANANLNDRVFTADSGFLCLEKSRAIESTNQSSSPYQTARIFYNQSYYEFKIAVNGTYIVRLHFLAFSSSSVNLSSALFDVSAFPIVSNSGFKLLSNFTAKNSSNSPLIEEFFLAIGPGSFKIYFAPQGSSFAFVNAIEVFRAPLKFSPRNYSSSFPLVLRTIYRVNVGGQKITPDIDTIWRNWEQDDRYLSNSTSAEDSRPSSQPLIRKSVESDGFVGADSDSIAPDSVYQTAKLMTRDTKGLPNAFNITWSFNVSADARHLVRVHFCDIIGPPGNLVFNLYSNGNFIKKVGGLDFSLSFLYLPFYYDFVLSSNGSEFINISVGPSTDTTTNNSFLNGLEMLEVIEGPALSNPPASVCNMKGPNKIKVGLVVGSVIGGLSLICILIVGILFGLKYRKAKSVETSELSPMPAFGGG
ncbi:putative receptor-like protein kinase [Prunus yedoensis var. nudiflora]|uniref:Putative receptor-like protein kinase n=1 Tax=Prunus yedoensis var. nudiflora TaxID=2094558 RepID=A0A314UQG2_PRUYE|nr:putative receptor-like protein kinase [Prunus yedoensis var. nudiflora]